MKEISDFSTSVMWRNVKLIHMWRNLKFLYMTDLFSTGTARRARDKYQV